METRAEDIMSTDVMTVQSDMSVEEVLKLLMNYKITGLPVVDKQNKMVGVVSEYDLLVQISKTKKLTPALFKQKITFSKKVDAISKDTDLDEVLKKFVNAQYRRVPVLDGKGRLVGIITRRDLIRVFYYRALLQ